MAAPTTSVNKTNNGLETKPSCQCKSRRNHGMEQVIVIVGCDNRVEFGPGMPGRYNCMLAEERAGMETRPYGSVSEFIFI